MKACRTCATPTPEAYLSADLLCPGCLEVRSILQENEVTELKRRLFELQRHAQSAAAGSTEAVSQLQAYLAKIPATAAGELDIIFTALSEYARPENWDKNVWKGSPSPGDKLAATALQQWGQLPPTPSE